MSSGRGSTLERYPVAEIWVREVDRYPVSCADKLVVRHIVVQRPDDPIAPKVDSRRGDHALVDVGVSQHVEPMPPVPHAVLFAGEQAIDDFLVSIGENRR